jgi:hypothetical protein
MKKYLPEENPYDATLHSSANGWITGRCADDSLMINVPGTFRFNKPATICGPVSPVVRVF